MATEYGLLIEHGGQLRAAARRYGIQRSEWLDLSTGINPHAWPVPPLCDEDWQRLPEDDDGLDAAAANYYGNVNLLAVPGSQVAIQLLPRMRARCRVGVVTPAYNEHVDAWRIAGHEVITLQSGNIDRVLPELDVLVLVNPSNPTGECFVPQILLEWRRQLAARGGWLVVDEAFMDVTMNESLVTHASLPGLVVLRSLSHFFGLAGARVGFVFGEMELLLKLEDELGPWAISHPSRSVAVAALEDNAWQRRMRFRLQEAGERLAQLLTNNGLQPQGGTALFHWVCTEHADDHFERLARLGILVRRINRPASLRFGLPGDDVQWERLEQGLQSLSVEREALV